MRPVADGSGIGRDICAILTKMCKIGWENDQATEREHSQKRLTKRSMNHIDHVP